MRQLGRKDNGHHGGSPESDLQESPVGAVNRLLQVVLWLSMHILACEKVHT